MGTAQSDKIQQTTAIERALEIQRDAASIGFDWHEVTGALDKVLEEVRELKEALEKNNREQSLDELGDLFFSLLNVVRFLDADPLLCLERTNVKFQQRFDLVKILAAEEA